MKFAQHIEVIKHTGDVTSIGVVVGTLVNLLPAISALLAIIWTCIRIYETKTVQKFLNKNNDKNKQ